MRISVFSAAAALALATPLLADTTDQVVTIPSAAGDFVGSLMTPESSPAPVVLLLHGFTGSRDELATDHVSEGIFVRTATRLAEAGYASLRIDFRGSGESTSDITYADTTFDGQVSDAIAAMDYLKSLNSVDGDDIFVIGWSQGGLVATGAAGRSDVPDAVALWNAVANAPQTYKGLFGAEVLAAGMAAAPDETTTTKLPWGAEVTLNGAFFDGIESFNAVAEIGDYAGPLFVASGTNDTTVLSATADGFIAAHDGPEKHWISEMDHAFNTFTTDETLEAMIAETIKFFDTHAD